MSPAVKKIFPLLGGALLLWLSAKYLLGPAMPFLLGVALALLAEPLVGALHGRLKLPRGIAAGIGVSLTLALVVLVLMTLGALAVQQLRSLGQILPDLQSTAQTGMAELEGILLDLAERTPPSLRPMAKEGIRELFSNGAGFAQQLTGKILQFASQFVSRVPERALGIATWLLASFMISARLPQLRALIKRRLPKSVFQQTLPMLRRLKKAMLGWLMAQGKLIGITFLILVAGFFILQVRHGPVWAFLIALADALPVLGTGTVLIPWGIICFFQGDTARALGLIGVYAVTLLTRSVLEPRLIGKQLGLDPLVTLAAMYTGYRLFGLIGMIFAPLAAVAAAQLLAVSKENNENFS